MTQKLMRYLVNFFNYFSMISLVVMMLVITADVLSRYILGSSLSWVYNFTESFLMVSIVFLGISYSYFEDDHIRFDLIINKVPQSAHEIIKLISHFIILILFILIGRQGMIQTIHYWEGNVTTGGSLPIPMFLSYIWVPIGSLLIILISILKISICISAIKKKTVQLFKKEKK